MEFMPLTLLALFATGRQGYGAARYPINFALTRLTRPAQQETGMKLDPDCNGPAACDRRHSRSLPRLRRNMASAPPASTPSSNQVSNDAAEQDNANKPKHFQRGAQGNRRPADGGECQGRRQYSRRNLPRPRPRPRPRTITMLSLKLQLKAAIDANDNAAMAAARGSAAHQRLPSAAEATPALPQSWQAPL